MSPAGGERRPEARAAPEVVGGYRVLRRIGEGGMGTVYEAEALSNGQRVALKLISPGTPVSDSSVDRFRREGLLASKITHPRCVFVLAADEFEGRPYIVMELMPGRTLQDLVEEQGPLETETAVARILDVIDGLREAHRLGVIHRDVKPSNCFLTADGRVKIGDFGLSKSLMSDARLTQTGAFLGTPLYASPEQVRGDAVDARTDVYSVAATLFFLLTGKGPFDGPSAAAVVARIASEPPASPRSLRAAIPPKLEWIVLRGLEKDRARRWRDMDALRTALLPFAPGQFRLGPRGLRTGAYILDWLVLYFLLWLPGQWLLPDEMSERSQMLVRAGISLSWFLYFVLLEGLLGATPGKRAFRLRVTGSTGAQPPGLGKAIVRTLVFYVLVGLPDDLPAFSLIEIPLRHGEIRFSWNAAWILAGFGLVVATMHPRNSYRGLHEFASGTRCLRLPRPMKLAPLRARAADLLSRAGASAADLPERLGAFQVQGALRRDGEDGILVGRDSKLGREALIWLRSPSAPSMNAARRDLDRPARLRWLGGGDEAGARWDAFLAPAGAPLAEVVEAHGPLDWPAFRPLLEALCRELAASRRDGTLPDDLSVSQVWVTQQPDLLLLDLPLSPAPRAAAGVGAGAGERSAEESAISLVRGTAALALEAKERARDAERSPIRAPSPIRAAVPLHARKLLDRLEGPARELTSAEEVLEDLEATRDQPDRITRRMRLVHVGLLTAAVWPFFFYGTFVQARAAHEPERVLSPFQAGLPLILPATLALSAFLTRGGLCLWFLGIAVVRRDGRKVSRIACALRALAVWLPISGLIIIATFLSSSEKAEHLAKYFGLSAMLLLLLYAPLAIFLPWRLPQDRLVGTVLVPR